MILLIEYSDGLITKHNADSPTAIAIGDNATGHVSRITIEPGTCPLSEIGDIIQQPKKTGPVHFPTGMIARVKALEKSARATRCICQREPGDDEPLCGYCTAAKLTAQRLLEP